MAISSTYLGQFGGSSGSAWVSENRSGRGLGTAMHSTGAGELSVVELRTTGTNRQIQILTGLSRLTVTLQTAGTYYQVLQPNSELSMESTVTFVRRMDFDA